MRAVVDTPLDAWSVIENTFTMKHIGHRREGAVPERTGLSCHPYWAPRAVPFRIGGSAGSIPHYDTQERVVDLQATVVLDEAQLPKLVHEEVHARAGGPNHLCQRFL
jgi:hypothetical protein